MALTVSFTPAKTVQDSEGASLYTSRWVAAHNPIVFKLSSDLFPTTTLLTQYQYQSVTESDDSKVLLNFTADSPPGTFTPGSKIRISGTIYNGTYTILKWNATEKTIEVDLAFLGTDSGTFGTSITNYVVQLRVLVGLPAAHKWQALKPETEVEVLEQIPNSSNVAVFDIQEAVQRKVTTENDLEQVSVPNDINIWTGFRVEYQEVYDQQVGGVGVLESIIGESSNSGRQSFTTLVSLDVQVGDYVQLNNFTDDEYNEGVFRVVFKSGTAVVIDLDFDSGLALNGYETIQKYDVSFISFESGYTSEGNQYYAVNSKLAPRSQYGSNLAIYVNNSDVTNEILFLSGFEGKTAFEGYYDDIALIVDKSLTDSLHVNETLSLRVRQLDENGNIINNQFLDVPNQEEGVYRLAYIDGIPPFIFELPSGPTLAHWFWVRPADFSYPPVATDYGTSETIELDGTVLSAVGDNFRYNSSGQTATRDREVFGGLCLSKGAGNAGSFWDFSSIGLTGVMTAICGWYKTNGGTVTLNKGLSGSDPEIDNTLKTFTPQGAFKYHDIQIFEGGVLFGRYRLEQKFDEVWLDSSGNGNHLTGSGVTTPADLWVEDDVNFNYANGDNDGFGHSIARTGGIVFDGTALTIGEIIPAITATLDARGFGDLEFRGRAALDGQILESPVATFDGVAYIDFTNSPNDLTGLTITNQSGAGTASKTNDTRIDITAGTLEYIELSNGQRLEFCNNAGQIVYGVRDDLAAIIGNIVSAPATLWTANTTNNRVFNQSKGANKFENILTKDDQYPLSGEIVTSSTYRLEIEFESYEPYFFDTGVARRQIRLNGTGSFLALDGNTLTYNGTGAGSSETISASGSTGLGTVAGSYKLTITVDSTANGGLGQLLITIENIDTTQSATGTDNDLATNGNNTGITIGFLGKGFVASNNPATRINSFKIWDSQITDSGVPDFWFKPQEANSNFGSGSAITITLDHENGYLPSALDANGDSTGQDVQGNALPDNCGFVFQDFDNLFQTNPSNAPALRFTFSVDDTEQLTYAQVVQDVDSIGLDRYLKAGDEKRDYILIDTSIATSEDIEAIVAFVARTLSSGAASSIVLDGDTASFVIQFGVKDNDLVKLTRTSEEKAILFERNICDNVYHLTWLNSLGGWEYWLFRGEKDYVIAIEEDIIAAKNLFENWDSDFINEETEFFFSSIEAYEEKEIRSNQLTADQADGIAKLKHSIQVQRINSDNTKFTVLVDKGNINIRRDEDFFAEIAFTIRETNAIPIQEQ